MPLRASFNIWTDLAMYKWDRKHALQFHITEWHLKHGKEKSEYFFPPCHPLNGWNCLLHIHEPLKAIFGIIFLFKSPWVLTVPFIFSLKVKARE